MKPEIEYHPLKPFLPDNAKILILGSFPPKKERWSMDFFYPNYINDMWRIMGIIFFNNKDFFVETSLKIFSKERVVAFCEERGLAFYDTALSVIRLKDNASDKYLNVVDKTDIVGLLEQLNSCCAIATTGQKATDIIVETFGCDEPKVGNKTVFNIGNKQLMFFRMPSTSRAYPLSLNDKTEKYREMFIELSMAKKDPFVGLNF
jgi:G:T/U-mismatch repair DNA glycosylase